MPALSGAPYPRCVDLHPIYHQYNEHWRTLTYKSYQIPSVLRTIRTPANIVVQYILRLWIWRSRVRAPLATPESPEKSGLSAFFGTTRP